MASIILNAWLSDDYHYWSVTVIADADAKMFSYPFSEGDAFLYWHVETDRYITVFNMTTTIRIDETAMNVHAKVFPL